MSASKPLIGVTSYRQPGKTGVWEGEFAMIPGDYLRGIEEAGGAVVLIPPQQLDRPAAEQILAGLDGLMLCGGRDVEPTRYGQEPLPTTEVPDTLRDHTEDTLLGVALETGLPVLGICRGAQVMNVHRGGTLIQHVPDVIGDSRYQRGAGEFSLMPVTLTEGSALSRAYGGATRLESVAMYHHQAIDQPGRGVVVSARSADDIVEGIEIPEHPFALAVQWHPEKTLDDVRIFRALVDAARHNKKVGS